MLLCGDARGDHVLELDAAGHVAKLGRLELDLLKLPHHGSIRNVEPDFYRRLPGYLISPTGATATRRPLRWKEAIAASRHDDNFTIPA